MTRCRVCDCKLKSGDICPRCEREQDWLNTRDYFCRGCDKHMPDATEEGYCAACAPGRPVPKVYTGQKDCPVCGQRMTKNGHCHACKSRELYHQKGKNEMGIHGKSNEICPECAEKLSKNGYCYTCKSWPFKKVPKMGTEKSVCNETAQTVTQASASVRPHGYQEMLGVGEYCPEPAAATIHAAPPPHAESIKINELDVCRDVINKHGISRQLAKAAEEFSEAAAAISRFLAGEGEYAEIIAEVADVEVMCVQMRMIYGAESIDQARAEKVARLHGRLKTEF